MEYEYIESIAGSKNNAVSTGRDIIDALAYAVTANIPYIEALKAFNNEGLQVTRLNTPIFGPWARIIRRLEKGAPLAEALQVRAVPSYIRHAVAYAEKKGTLPQILPLLAQNMHLRRVYNTAELLVFANIFVWIMAAGMVIFIYPNLYRTFGELLEREVFLLPELVVKWVPPAIIAAIIVFLLTLEHYFFEIFYIRVPYIGTVIKQRILGELSGTFYCMLAGGADMTEAARTVLAAEPRWWLRRRLRKFIARLDKGENWLDAWEQEIRLETPLTKWFFHNGVMTDHVTENFGKLRYMLQESNIGASRNLHLFLAMGILFVNALLVGFLGYCFFSALIGVMNQF